MGSELSTPAVVRLLAAGVVGGALTLLVAFRARRYTRPILFIALLGAQAVYVHFAVRAGETPAWLALEVGGVLLFGLLAYPGLSGSAWWLAAGWALHVVWDMGLHHFGPGRRFAPLAYPIACLSWDLLVAGYVAWRITRGWDMAPELSAAE
jgi:hypothetical protein